MAKINDTTTFPNTTPAGSDHVIGTDISDTGNDANGEVVTFSFDSMRDLVGFKSGWHPYDMTDYGGSEDGQLWDFATDGSTSSVAMTFAAGYDYLITFDNFGHSDGTARKLQFITTDSNSNAETLSFFTSTANDVPSGEEWSGRIMLRMPKLSSVWHQAEVAAVNVNGLGNNWISPGTEGQNSLWVLKKAAARTLDSAVLQYEGVSITSGTVRMYRQRNYAAD